MMTPEGQIALGKINPELEEILKKSPYVGDLNNDTDHTKIRAFGHAKWKAAVAADQAAGDTTYVEEDRQIQVRDGTSITVRIHKPKTLPKDGCPIFVVYHGGGFVLGGLDNETLLCRAFTRLGGIAVNVDYRLAPENPFPTSCNDAYDALKWTAAHFEDLGGNPEKGFMVGGISAGANLTTIVTHLYRDDKLLPPLTGAYVSIPGCIPPDSVPEKYKHLYLSREQNQNAPILGQNAITWFEKKYNPDYTSKLRNPMMFPSHKDLPPTYFQICGLDPLRDEGFIYEEILREENGVKTLVDVYPGLPHGFWGTWMTADFSVNFPKDCVKGMKWLLEQST